MTQYPVPQYWGSSLASTYISFVTFLDQSSDFLSKVRCPRLKLWLLSMASCQQTIVAHRSPFDNVFPLVPNVRICQKVSRHMLHRKSSIVKRDTSLNAPMYLLKWGTKVTVTVSSKRLAAVTTIVCFQPGSRRVSFSCQRLMSHSLGPFCGQYHCTPNCVGPSV